MKVFVVYWLPVVLWMGFLFPATNNSLSLNSTSHIIVPVIRLFLPNADEQTVHLLHVLIRKFIHFWEYALLAFLLYRGFNAINKGNRKGKSLLFSGIIAVSYGFLDEFLQYFISTRTGSITDGFINMAGVILVLTIISLKVHSS
jgi:VanZ family protein